MKRRKCHRLLTCGFFFIVLVLLYLIIVKSPLNEEYSDLFPRGPEEILRKGEERNLQRVKRVEDICRKYNLGRFKTINNSSIFKYPPTPQYSVFYIDRENKIAYCPTYKGGSTSWLFSLLQLTGRRVDAVEGRRQISEVARTWFPALDGDEAERIVVGCRRLLCVRHPFERLLSAFRDKLEDKDRDPESGTRHYYKRWGAKIRARYRSNGPPEPTFTEFVRYLIETDLLKYADDHWIPYNAYCTPCLISYDYIFKTETLLEDQLYLRQSALPSLVPQKKHTSTRHSSHLAADYFSRLSKTQVRQLHDKFQLDFIMFDYSIEPYLSFAKDQQSAAGL